MATPETSRNHPIDIIPIEQQTDFTYDSLEDWPPICTIINRNVHKMYKNRKQIVKNRLPVLKWLPSYRLNYLFYDFIAGITVGLTAIPQGIAYAVVAGLPPEYGLYAGFSGVLPYLLFGSCKDVIIGPTAILALLINRYVIENRDFATFLAFINGAMIFLFGLLNLGFLVQFISIPVVIGFTIAASMTIGSSQIKSLLGLKGATNTFIEAWSGVFKQINETKLWDPLLGAFSIIILILLKRLTYKKNLSEIGSNESVWKNECKKYLVLGRNAIVVVFGTALAYVLHTYGHNPFALTGQVSAGLPAIKIPPFHTKIGDKTLYFTDMIAHIGTTIIALPLISILESIAVAKAFSKGRTIDATQEMLALGMCNLFGSFFQSMPVTGSITRTAVNNASGVCTTLSGIAKGALIMLALGFLTNTFRFIPKTTLAAVIICAMFSMVDVQEIKDIWRSKRIDIIPLICTLIACLALSIEFGILIGIGINIAFVLYNMARPNILVYNRKVLDHEMLVLLPDQCLTFSSSDHIKAKVLKYVNRNTANIIIIDGRYVRSIDTTVAKSIRTIVGELHLQNKKVYFWNWGKEPMGVLCRLDNKLYNLFRDIQADDEAWKSLNRELSIGTESVIRI